MPPAAIFERWHMDIIGSLTPTKEKYQYILVCVDSFSHFVEAFPVQTQESAEVAKIFYREIICRYGAHSSLVTDRGKYHVKHHDRTVQTDEHQKVCHKLLPFSNERCLWTLQQNLSPVTTFLHGRTSTKLGWTPTRNFNGISQSWLFEFNLFSIWTSVWQRNTKTIWRNIR